MDGQSIIDWLVSSAGAAWIIGILGFAFGIFQWLRGRARPSRVIAEQALDTTLLSAPRDLPDVERVRILYGEEPIDMLWMTELRVRNAGNTVISEPDIYIRVDNETKVLDVQLQNVPSSPELEETCSLIKENTVKVAYPYLNPFHEHKQETTIKLLCNRKPQTLTVEGGGKGWSVVFLSSAEKKKVKSKVGTIAGRLLYVSLGPMFVAALILYSVQPERGTDIYRLSVLLFLFGLVSLFSSSILVSILERWLSGRLR